MIDSNGWRPLVDLVVNRSISSTSTIQMINNSLPDQFDWTVTVIRGGYQWQI